MFSEKQSVNLLTIAEKSMSSTEKAHILSVSGFQNLDNHQTCNFTAFCCKQPEQPYLSALENHLAAYYYYYLIIGGVFLKIYYYYVVKERLYEHPKVQST